MCAGKIDNLSSEGKTMCYVSHVKCNSSVDLIMIEILKVDLNTKTK